MKKGINYEKYNKMIADKINEGLYQIPPDIEKIKEFAKAMSDLLYRMRAESDLAMTDLSTPNTNNPVPQEFIDKIIDDQVHSTAMKIIIENDIINHLIQCPNDYKNDKGEYEYIPDCYDFVYVINSYVERMYEDLNETKQVMVCTNCKSDNVQVKMWVKANTNEVIDSAGDDSGEDSWCEDCQGHHELEVKTMKPRAKVIGFQVVDDKNDIHPHMDASFCIYNLEQARSMMDDDNNGEESWRLLTIWEDDIEEPTMMFSGLVR